MLTEEFEVIPEVSAQSKFQFLDGPLQQLPMKCAACYRYDNSEPGREGHLRFLDFNQEFEFYGKLFICVDCLREIVNQLGWATEEQVKRASNMIKDLMMQVSTLSQENENLRNAVGNLSTIAVGGRIPGSDLMVGMEAPEPDDDGESRDPNESVKPAEDFRAPDEESTGSTDESGSTDLRDDDDLSKLLDSI